MHSTIIFAFAVATAAAFPVTPNPFQPGKLTEGAGYKQCKKSAIRYDPRHFMCHDNEVICPILNGRSDGVAAGEVDSDSENPLAKRAMKRCGDTCYDEEFQTCVDDTVQSLPPKRSWEHGIDLAELLPDLAGSPDLSGSPDPEPMPRDHRIMPPTPPNTPIAGPFSHPLGAPRPHPPYPYSPSSKTHPPIPSNKHNVKSRPRTGADATYDTTTSSSPSSSSPSSSDESSPLSLLKRYASAWRLNPSFPTVVAVRHKSDPVSNNVQLARETKFESSAADATDRTSKPNTYQGTKVAVDGVRNTNNLAYGNAAHERKAPIIDDIADRMREDDTRLWVD